MAVNYNDERFQKVEAEKNEQIQQTTNTYNEMIDKTDSYYQQQIDATKDWQTKQEEIQKANTDFAIEKIEQQKEQTEKDYIKEQKGAYTDYQKATNPFGVNAEKQATQGLQNSGYSESARTSMYNTYQNRYMSARESYNKAVLNYDNAIKEAQLANNSALATIAYEALQKQLELSLQGFQYKNSLILQKTEALNTMNDRYYQRYQDVLAQINTENALARSYSSSGGSSTGQEISLIDSTVKDENTTSSSNNRVGAIPVKQDSSTAVYGTLYNEALKATRTIYNTSRTNKRQAAEMTLATYIANGTVTQAGAEKILQTIGITKIT